MIECMKYRAAKKEGCLQGFATLYVEKWGIEIRDCTLYEKDTKMWVNFPSKEYVNKEGKKAFAPLIRFHEKGIMYEFSKQAKEAIFEYQKKHGVIYDEII